VTGAIIQVSVSAGGVPNYAIARGEVTHRGIVGDGWRHPAFHGIPRRALLLITSEGLEEIGAMGFSVFPGALGENLTTVGLDRRELRIGQRLRCGTAAIEITELRLPCDTISVFGNGLQDAIYDRLAARGSPESAVWGLSGFYASVIEPGEVRPGDRIRTL